jgi:hypothetical protein
MLFLAAGALLLLPLVDCMSAMSADEQSMQCCAAMSCTPANLSHGCCKTMSSPRTPNVAARTQVSIHAPILTAVEYMQAPDDGRAASMPRAEVDARQQSPPELYTLHASLLI